MLKEITIRCESIRVDRDQYKLLKVALEGVDLQEFFNSKETIDFCSKNYIPEDLFTVDQLKEWYTNHNSTTLNPKDNG